MKKYIYILILLNSTNSFAQTNAEEKIKSGIENFKKKEYKKAEKDFTDAIEFGKDSNVLKAAYIKKGLTLNELEDFEKAIICFNKAYDLDKSDMLTLVDRGTTYLYLNKIEDAKQDFNKILSISTKDKPAEASYYYLGKIFIQEGDFDKAIICFDKLIELNNSDYETYYLRGIAKGNKMDFDGSIADYDKAIKYNPNYMEAFANRGTMKLNKIPVNDKIKKDIECLTEPCLDLIKAKELGDTEIEDLLYLYCRKCK